MTSARASVAAIGLALLLPGCVHPENERLAIGTAATPSFGGRSGPGMTGGEPVPRRAWTTRVAIIPVDGVVHSGTLRTPAPVGRRSDAVTVGAYPDPAGIAEREGNEAWRTLRAMGRTAGEVLLMPLRGVVGLVADDRGWSPTEIWKRAPGAVVREGTIGAIPNPPSDTDAGAQP